MESILTSIKKLLGLTEDYEAFDTDIIIHINTYLGVLNQLGVGKEGFTIEGYDDTWDDFLEDHTAVLNEAKTYVYLRVRQVFDPPTSSVLGQAFDKQIDELGWRMMEKVALIDPDKS